MDPEKAAKSGGQLHDASNTPGRALTPLEREWRVALRVEDLEITPPWR